MEHVQVWLKQNCANWQRWCESKCEVCGCTFSIVLFLSPVYQSFACGYELRVKLTAGVKTIPR